MTSRPDAGKSIGSPGFALHLEALRGRLSATHEADETTIAELETAYEELRVADEEVRAQQEQIGELVETKRLLRWQHERMLTVLPVPVLTTDHQGSIRSVNAAAAGLAGIRVVRLLRKPIFSLFASDDRRELRRQLGAHARDGESFRRAATLLRRDEPPVPVEVLVSVLPGTPDEVSWMVLSPYAVGDAPSAERRVLAEALARLAALPVTEQPLQTVLHEAAHICQDVLGNDGVLSVNVGDPRSPTAVASTDTSAQQLDGDQMSTDQGPCFDAFDQRTTVVSNDLSTDDRWPVLAQHAAPLAGAVSAPLQVGEDLVGMLNVYVTGTPDRDLVDAVELLSTTIAALLVDMQIRDELLSTAHQFELALTSRATIDQAKGVIMAHRHCGPEEAFQHLVDLSSARNVKLRDLAKEIVERASM